MDTDKDVPPHAETVVVEVDVVVVVDVIVTVVDEVAVVVVG
jgi:hypothetical protein